MRPKRHHRVNVRNVRPPTWPLVTWRIGSCARRPWKNKSPLLLKTSLSSCLTAAQCRFWSWHWDGEYIDSKMLFSPCLHAFQPSIINSWRKNVNVILCKCTEWNITNILVKCEFYVLWHCWITNDVGLTCLLECCHRIEQHQTFSLYLIKPVTYCRSKLIHSDRKGRGLHFHSTIACLRPLGCTKVCIHAWTSFELLQQNE